MRQPWHSACALQPTAGVRLSCHCLLLDRAAARGGADPQQAWPRLNGSPDKKASAPPGEWSTPSPDNGAGRPARGPMPIYTPLGSHMHTQSSGLSAGNTSVHNGPVPVHAGLLAPPEYSGMSLSLSAL